MPNCECGKPYDLEKNHLVPASRIAEETAKRQAAEAKVQAKESELAAAQSALSLSSTRLQFASGAPDENKARQLVGAYEAAIKGMEKPPSLEAWAADPAGGAWIAAALRPAAPAPAPAGSSPAPVPAPAPAGAAPAPAPAIPNTNTGTLPTQPAPPSKDALVRQYDELNQRYARAPHAERPALLKEIGEVEAKIRALIGAAT